MKWLLIILLIASVSQAATIEEVSLALQVINFEYAVARDMGRNPTIYQGQLDKSQMTDLQAATFLKEDATQFLKLTQKVDDIIAKDPQKITNGLAAFGLTTKDIQDFATPLKTIATTTQSADLSTDQALRDQIAAITLATPVVDTVK